MSGEHDVRTEKVDVDPRSIRRAGLWLAAVTLGAMIVLLPLLSVFEDLAETREPEARPLSLNPDRQPPAPRLQRYPTLDVERLHAEEDGILGSYGWVDRDKGVVRVPIERAMALVVERGLPATPPSPAAAPREGAR